MTVLNRQITREELCAQYNHHFDDMIKGVVDVSAHTLAIDAELHADLESLLLAGGSSQENLWGINLWPEETGEDFIEFDSLINIRPWQGNRSRDVCDPAVRQQIIEVVNQWIK